MDIVILSSALFWIGVWIGLDEDINHKLIDYIRSRHSENVMKANKITIQIYTGTIIVKNNDANEGIYDILNLQMNDNLKPFYSVLRYVGSL